MKNEAILYNNKNCSARITKSREVSKGVFYDKHNHKEIEFIYVVSGKILVSSNNTQLIVQSNEIAFIDSDVVHSTLTLEDDTIYCLIQFSYRVILKYPFKYLLLFTKQHSHPLYIFKKDDICYERILECILDMLEKNSENNLTNDYFLASDIYKIIALLFERKIISSNDYLLQEDLNKFISVFEYIDLHFSEPITLKALANLISYNKDYFCRTFKKATGITVFEYLNFVRICKAEELFPTNKSLTEISNMIGFSSTTYFNKVFKKYKGVSPSKYKKYYMRNTKKLVTPQFDENQNAIF